MVEKSWRLRSHPSALVSSSPDNLHRREFLASFSDGILFSLFNSRPHSSYNRVETISMFMCYRRVTDTPHKDCTQINRSHRMKCRARFVSLKSDSLYFSPRQGKSDSRHEITHTNGNLTVSADEIGAHRNTVLDTSLLACLVIFLCYLHHEEIIKYASLQSSCSSQWKDNIFTLIWILLTIEHLNPGFKARSIQNNVTVLEKRQNQFCFLCSKEDNIRHDGTGRVHSIMSQMILSVKHFHSEEEFT